MKSIGRLGAATLLVLAACSEGTSPSNHGPRSGTKSQLRASPQAVSQGGNNFYQVFVLDVAGPGVGQYTVMTGPSHPVTISTGSPKNVLFGDGGPGTSYNTIFSYTTGTAYVAAADFRATAGIVILDPLTPGITATVTALGSTGFRTTYTLAGPPQTPDKLTIVQDVNTHGTTFETSTVEVTTTVTNSGSAPVSIGLRYLWDTQIGEDDGPTFQQLSPDAAVIVNEKSFVSPSFGFYRIQDNDGNTPSPLFSVFGTVTQPTTITPPPTPPDLLVNASWPSSVGAAFAYTPNPSTDVSTVQGGVNDNAILYYWGPTQATAIAIAAGASRTFSQSLVSGEANAPPPFNQPPTAQITSPTNNASFAQGASVSFAGTGTDPEDGALTGASLVWTDDVSGQIGTGTSFSLSSLAVGTHTITLTATDSQGAKGTATVSITITGSTTNQPPTAHITAPANNDVFTTGSSISFAGTGSDPEDGALTGASLVWTDNVAGQIGTGTSFSLSALAEGPHTITLTATDSKGATGTATVSIIVGFTQAVGAAGGSLCVETCHLSFYIPPGALSSTVTFVEYNLASPPSAPSGIVGGAHVISPTVSFAVTGEIGIGYDPNTLPSGISESSLRIYQFTGGSWQLVANGNVNTTSHIVYAPVNGTGTFAIVGTP
ncbi:MAG: hypothetical protein JJD97_04445 [Gemmatimonadaceae bacterium]|nr:hypothetical protein [Gemmatimonadaceae bacterium]